MGRIGSAGVQQRSEPLLAQLLRQRLPHLLSDARHERESFVAGNGSRRFLCSEQTSSSFQLAMFAGDVGERDHVIGTAHNLASVTPDDQRLDMMLDGLL